MPLEMVPSEVARACMLWHNSKGTQVAGGMTTIGLYFTRLMLNYKWDIRKKK